MNPNQPMCILAIEYLHLKYKEITGENLMILVVSPAYEMDAFQLCRKIVVVDPLTNEFRSRYEVQVDKDFKPGQWCLKRRDSALCFMFYPQ